MIVMSESQIEKGMEIIMNAISANHDNFFKYLNYAEISAILSAVILRYGGYAQYLKQRGNPKRKRIASKDSISDMIRKGKGMYLDDE